MHQEGSRCSRLVCNALLVMLLHITNGDGAAALLAAGGCAGEILPWRDVLHEGPVPALELAALSRIRAEFLASRGWGALPALCTSFATRDRTLAEFRAYDELVLWFEHDLYDQLQLAQVLSFLASEERNGSCITLICIDRHEGVTLFRGLADLMPTHVAPLFAARGRVTGAAYHVASEAWGAFTGADPSAVESFLASDSSALPFMRAALLRHLQELPSTFNGLGRTAHHALNAVASGCIAPVSLLEAHWDQETAPFMGDWSFWHELQSMARAPAPLLTIEGACSERDMQGATLSVTDEGAAVLTGKLDAIHLRGIDRWYGGVHLMGRHARWRWDASECCVVRG